MKICSFDPEHDFEFSTEIASVAKGRIVEALDSGVALCEWPEPADLLFCRHRFPVQSVATLEADSFQPEVLAYLQPDFDISPLSGVAYSIQIRANSRLPWSLGDLAQSWRENWALSEEGWAPRQPQNVLSVYLNPEKSTIYMGISSVDDNLSPWSGGLCRIPKDKDSVSRAEQKLREALELLPTLQGGKALDLGAAPGGWTRVAVEHGFEVDAVDPADLDPKVGALKAVHHYQTTTGDFLSEKRSPYDLILCDMKMDAKLAARQLTRVSKLLKGNGVLITTLKLPKKGERLKACNLALAEMKKAFTVVKARQLYFNRSEITVIAKRR